MPRFFNASMTRGSFFHRLVHSTKFTHVDRSLDVLALFPGFEFAAGDVDQRFDGEALAQQDYFGFAEDGIAALPGEDFVLGGFVQQNAMGDGVGVDLAGVAQDVVDGPVFLCFQCVQRMLRGSVLAEKQERKKNCNGSCSERPLDKTGHKSSEFRNKFRCRSGICGSRRFSQDRDRKKQPEYNSEDQYQKAGNERKLCGHQIDDAGGEQNANANGSEQNGIGEARAKRGGNRLVAGRERRTDCFHARQNQRHADGQSQKNSNERGGNPALLHGAGEGCEVAAGK